MRKRAIWPRLARLALSLDEYNNLTPDEQHKLLCDQYGGLGNADR